MGRHDDDDDDEGGIAADPHVDRDDQSWEAAQDGAELIAEGNPEEAVRVLSKLVQEQPDNEHAWFFLGAAHYELTRYDQALADPHLAARGMVEEVDHPVIGRMKAMGRPLKSSGELTAIRRPAPLLGEHSAETLRGLGYPEAEIASLLSAKVIYDGSRRSPAEAPRQARA